MQATATSNSPEQHVDVLIAGGGPCGLMLANELGRRQVSVLLVNDKPDTAFNPQANATQARTMEHYRRLGFADEIRALGLPPDFPTDIAYFTRFARHELARFKLPSSAEAKRLIASMTGAWSAAELPHRVSQKFVEQVLRRHAAALPSVDLRFGWRLASFDDEIDRVVARLESVDGGESRVVTARFLVGADGPRSMVRQRMGWKYTGETGVQRDFMGGRMYAIYARAPDFYRAVPHAPAWMNVSFNADRRAFMAAVDGKGEFAFHTQLQPFENENELTDDDARRMFQAATGVEVPVEILSRGTWTAGHCLVSEHLHRGRVFIGGDAAHLFTPTGGLGYNTAIEDAVNLGWKLAAVLRGTAGPGLLDSYERERRPLAVRNTNFARAFADSLGLFEPEAAIEQDSETGERARSRAGEYLSAHGRKEFNIPGVTFGGRYDESPVIARDGTAPPPDLANDYVPSACPGGRAPHAWLSDRESLYDRFGFEWTLLHLGGSLDSAAGFVAEAAERHIDLKVVTLHDPALRQLYEADFALIRPDQIVAWRGSDSRQARDVWATVLGDRTAI